MNTTHLLLSIVIVLQIYVIWLLKRKKKFKSIERFKYPLSYTSESHSFEVDNAKDKTIIVHEESKSGKVPILQEFLSKNQQPENKKEEEE